MRATRLCVLALSISAGFAARAAKPAEVEVTSIKLRREGDLILVDTSLKNATAKPIRGLVAIYKFFSPTHEALSTHRSSVDEAVVEAGAETEIHAQLSAPPKAVTVEVSAQIEGGRELRVGNTGPFTIE